MKNHPRIAADTVLDGEGCIAQDLACLACGYNLRGLQPTGRCPECGTAVGRSAYGDLLRFCEPTWVNRLADGMNWIAAGIILSFLLAILAGVLVAALLHFMIGSIPDQVLRSAATLLSGLIQLIGYWKVTEPEPGGLQCKEQFRPRRLARYTTVAVWSISVLNVPFACYPGLCAGVVALVSSALLLFNTLVIFTYARQMATRIPDLSLARQTRMVMWGLSVGLIAVSFFRLSCVVRLMNGASPGPRPLAGLGLLNPNTAAESIVTWVAGFAIMIFGLWSLHLVDRFRKASREAARLARATWAKGPEEGS